MNCLLAIIACFLGFSGVETTPALEGTNGKMWYGEHRGIGISFLLPGLVMSQREWNGVDSPRKFSFELHLDVKGASVYFQVFDLDDKDGDWWLHEVMGFLFEPETTVSSEVTRTGYEVYCIDIPGGGGVYPQTELLLLGDGAAFRFTCIRCRETGAFPLLMEALDTFEMLRITP